MEENTSYKNTCYNMNKIIEGLKDKYNKECIDYHCRKIDSGGFIKVKEYI